MLIVTRLDRLARSTRDLLNVLDAVAGPKLVSVRSRTHALVAARSMPALLARNRSRLITMIPRSLPFTTELAVLSRQHSGVDQSSRHDLAVG